LERRGTPRAGPSRVPRELVAFASRERVRPISPRMRTLRTGNPELRFVAYMCAYCGEVLQQAASRPADERVRGAVDTSGAHRTIAARKPQRLQRCGGRSGAERSARSGSRSAMRRPVSHVASAHVSSPPALSSSADSSSARDTRQAPAFRRSVLHLAPAGPAR
jgi:hypothetical protein